MNQTIISLAKISPGLIKKNNWLRKTRRKKVYIRVSKIIKEGYS